MIGQRNGQRRRGIAATLAAVAALLVALAVAPAAPAYDFYFGDLHAHTGYSDGASGTTPWQAFPAAIAAGADFMALSEHYSTSNAYEAWAMDAAGWQDLGAAAAHFTSARFVAMPAYEFYPTPSRAWRSSQAAARSCARWCPRPRRAPAPSPGR